MGKKFKWIAFGVLVLVFLLLILRFPLNEYEWMLDPELGSPIELPYDNRASMYPFFAGAPALTLWVFYFCSKVRRDKMIVLLVIGILFVVWVIKFRSILFGVTDPFL